MKNTFTKRYFTCLFLLVLGLSGRGPKAYAQVANSGFETGTLAGWSATSGVSVSAGYSAGNWTVNPSGGGMARMEPSSGLRMATAEANLGLPVGALNAFNNGVFSKSSNFGTLTQSVTLNAGQTFTMYWNYLSQDYAPFNDGVVASLTGPGYQNLQLLAVTANAYGDAQTIVTGSYGSTGWHAVTFTAGAAGTYKLGFADFNSQDEAYSPIQANDNAPGGTSAPGQPVVTTAPVTSVSPTTATSGGNVTADGGSAVTARGVCWSTATAPTTANAYTTNGTGLGAFTASLTGLTVGATYYVRAYATNITGTIYGPTVTLTGDTQAPVITTNGNLTVSTDAGSCTATVAVSATAADNVSTVTPTGVRADGLALNAAYPKGLTTIEWSATDAAGNATTATQTVTVSDTEKPTIAAPAPVVASTDAGQCAATNVALGTATAADNCSDVTTTNDAPTTFAKGTTTITWTATDAAGNTATATQTVTVNDTEKPSAIAKNLTVSLDTNGQASVTAAQLNDGSRDNCGVATLALDKTSFDCGSLGDNAVLLTVTDASGNTATATATVTVQSALAVALTSANSNCYNARNGSSSAAVTGGTAATYAWTGPNGFSAATASISNLAPGAYTLTVTTAVGCTASASTTITEPINLAPQANADQLTTTACTPLIITPAMLLGNDTDPQNQALEVAEVLNPTNGTLVANANGTFTFTPAAGFTGAATFRYVAKKNDNTVAYSGNGHFYEYIASNGITWANANSAAAARTYLGLKGYLATITSAGENAFAAAKLQGNGWIGASDAQTEGNWKWVTGPEAGQQFWQGLASGYRVNNAYANWQGGEPNNAGNEDYAHFYSGLGTWNDFPNSRPGDIQGYVVEYGGLESCLPVLTSTATVAVNVTPVAPTALARNLTVALDANGTATITAAQLNNGSTAACAITALSVAPSTFGCANTGTNQVTLTVTDASGLSSTAKATVTVIDNTLPTIAAPANVSVSADAGQCSASGVALGTATAADNCSATVTNDAPATFAKGLTTVTWTATDAAGNTATATQTVAVSDAEKPTIAAPAALTVSTDADQCAATNVALGTATATDNCSDVVVSNDAPATFAKGTTTVLWTATDAAGNVATATQTVTVNDTQLPTILAPAAVVASTDAGQCAATNVALGNATAADNCADVTIANDAPATFAKGTTTVLWTATDAAGNTATATQTVTVNDTELPMIAAPAAVTVSTDRGQCSATNVALGNSVAQDNCGATVTNDAPATFAKGTTTVLWTATDAAGNTATATQTVTVNDTEQPVLAVPANLVANAPATQCGATVTFAPTATDNCAGATVVASPASGSTFPVGTSTVAVTATDASGNVSTGSFTVTVQDVTAPAVAVRNVTVTLVNGAATVTAADVNNNSTDACGIASYALNRSAFTCANLGNNPVVLTVTDIHGNVASASAIVTVVGSIPAPAIAVTPASNVYTGGVATNLYLGYGSQSVTLTATGGVSYVWSPAKYLNSNTVANPVFTATAAGTYTYTVTATNQYGCTATKTVTLRVVDARCDKDKVVVCHNGHEICISPNAVPAHLSGHAGDQLGACGTTARPAAPAATAALANELVFEAYPNPFGASTTVHFRPTVSAAAQIRVFDSVGRVVGTLFSGTTEAGHDYNLPLDGTPLAAGLYLCRYESQGQVHTQRLSVVK